MPNKVYTWGYTGSKPADILAYVDALGALLVDIRFSPQSRVPHWSGRALEELVGPARYTHLKALGNENYRTGGEIGLHDPEAAAVHLAAVVERRPVILLCACEDWRLCHRAVAAAYLSFKLGTHVEHLPGRFSEWQSRKGKYNREQHNRGS